MPLVNEATGYTANKKQLSNWKCATENHSSNNGSTIRQWNKFLQKKIM